MLQQQQQHRAGHEVQVPPQPHRGEGEEGYYPLQGQGTGTGAYIMLASCLSFCTLGTVLGTGYLRYWKM